MARILSEIGWKVTLVDGGYKTYRKAVLNGLDDVPPRLRPIILRGRTGTAKTRILRAAMEAGAQVIDLEGLANHRGSLLGPEPEFPNLPSGNSSRVCSPCLDRFRSREARVHRGGKQQDRRDPYPARTLEMHARRAGVAGCRAARGTREIPDVGLCPYRCRAGTAEAADELGRHADRARTVDEWRGCVESGDWTGFVSRVLEDHYDPAYDRSAATRGHDDLGELVADNLDDATIASLAGRLAAWQ